MVFVAAVACVCERPLTLPARGLRPVDRRCRHAEALSFLLTPMHPAGDVSCVIVRDRDVSDAPKYAPHPNALLQNRARLDSALWKFGEACLSWASASVDDCDPPPQHGPGDNEITAAGTVAVVDSWPPSCPSPLLHHAEMAALVSQLVGLIGSAFATGSSPSLVQTLPLHPEHQWFMPLQGALGQVCRAISAPLTKHRYRTGTSQQGQ